MNEDPKTVGFRILSTVSIVVDGNVVRTGAGHESTLLALLVANPGYAFAIDSIVTAVWGANPPAVANRSLHVYISKLRRLLATHSPGPTPISGGAGWYRLDVDPQHTDIGRFRTLIAAARSTAHDNANLYRRALAEITGDALAGLPTTPFTCSFRETVAEMALDAEIAMYSASRPRFHPTEVTARMRELATEHPYDERLWAMLIEALHASGRRAEAVLAGRQLTAALADRLGLDPSADLIELLRRVETDPGYTRASA
ncbi:AfsR/SARP family transcriptional regulator [Tsukamurella tyrosinosolvens]|uniref:AfsR/SARP family transcriptional regulator n=1 Tax=Tsukamurella tyrosinosolvens TaxID=57704 RepID=UPI000C7F0703|nr:BTAD domain-containing putative transcriptional regulator [Tsukamurella tyrosinosolvens]AUN41842.1 hypothetical protein ASU32_19045 [Tsukamurella tyrosinosolvens]